MFMTGFYSKDFILESAYGQFYFSGTVVYYIATIGAMFTTLYLLSLSNKFQNLWQELKINLEINSYIIIGKVESNKSNLITTYFILLFILAFFESTRLILNLLQDGDIRLGIRDLVGTSLDSSGLSHLMYSTGDPGITSGGGSTTAGTGSTTGVGGPPAPAPAPTPAPAPAPAPDDVYLGESDNERYEEGSPGSEDMETLENLQAQCDREKCLYDNAKERVKSAFEKGDLTSVVEASREAGQNKNSYFSKLAELNELETTHGYPITSSEITEQTGNESPDDDSSGESDKVSLPDRSNKGFVQSKK